MIDSQAVGLDEVSKEWAPGERGAGGSGWRKGLRSGPFVQEGLL